MMFSDHAANQRTTSIALSDHELYDHSTMLAATVLTDRFDRALLYATHVHGGQVRKETTIPYIAHLLAVAATVLEYGGSEDMAIAGLLHDAAEDQGGERRLADIRNRFGDRVADIVHACSDSVINTAAGQQKDFTFDITGHSLPNDLGWVAESWTFTATGPTTTLELTPRTIPLRASGRR